MCVCVCVCVCVQRVFSGHSGFIHCLCLRTGGNILSSAEDGTVKMWGEKYVTTPSSLHPSLPPCIDVLSKDPAITWKPTKVNQRCLCNIVHTYYIPYHWNFHS